MKLKRAMVVVDRDHYYRNVKDQKVELDPFQAHPPLVMVDDRHHYYHNGKDPLVELEYFQAHLPLDNYKMVVMGSE